MRINVKGQVNDQVTVNGRFVNEMDFKDSDSSKTTMDHLYIGTAIFLLRFQQNRNGLFYFCIPPKDSPSTLKILYFYTVFFNF